MKQKEAEVLFNELYDKTFNEVYGYILAKTGDIGATPKILESCYATVYQKFLSMKSDTINNKRSYLFKTVREHLVKYNELQTRPDATPSKDAKVKNREAKLLKELETEFPNPRSREEFQSLLSDILDFISTKPVIQQRAFLLHFLYDFSIEEVAKQLSLTHANTINYIYHLSKEIRVKFYPQESAK